MANKKELPDVPEIRYLEVVLMPNGEIICFGCSIGWYDKFGQFIKKEVPEKKEAK